MPNAPSSAARRAAAVAVSAAGCVVLAGCAAAPVPVAVVTALPAGTGRTPACGLVSPVDATVLTRVGAWDVRETTSRGRRTCRLRSAAGPTIVVVTVAAAHGLAPAGLCAPKGSVRVVSELGPVGTLCRSTGPTVDSAALVALRGRTVVGVTVTGFAAASLSTEPMPLAGELLEHALTHL